MRKGMVVLFLVTALFIPTVAGAADDSARKELEMLRHRIEQLEKRLNAGERERAEIKEKNDEISAANKELKKIRETFGRLSLGGGITGIVQGTVNNDGNAPEFGEVTDGSYSVDLEVEADLDKWGTAFIHLEAGDGDNVTDEIGALTGVNADALGPQNDLEVAEAWWEFSPFGIKPLTITLGKLDPTAYWDANEAANDETAQFLADMFVNSIAVEWPDYTPGIRIAVAPGDTLSFSVGVLSGDSDWEDVSEDVFAIAEIGFKAKFGGLEGNYRFYGWINGVDHLEWRDVALGKTRSHKDNRGFGLSFDQNVSADVTLFCRFGWQDGDIAGVSYAPGGVLDPIAVEYTWSVGGQVTGARWNRPDDVIGLAVGQALLSDDFEDMQQAAGVDPEDEFHLELYYSIFLNDYVAVSPDFQLIDNMGGDDDADTVYVFGIRCQLSF